MVEGFLYHKLLTKFSFLSITPLLEIYKAYNFYLVFVSLWATL